jgi:hypothetical protein
VTVGVADHHPVVTFAANIVVGSDVESALGTGFVVAAVVAAAVVVAGADPRQAFDWNDPTAETLVTTWTCYVVAEIAGIVVAAVVVGPTLDSGGPTGERKTRRESDKHEGTPNKGTKRDTTHTHTQNHTNTEKQPRWAYLHFVHCSSCGDGADWTGAVLSLNGRHLCVDFSVGGHTTPKRGKE